MRRVKINWTIHNSVEMEMFIKDILSDGSNLWVRDTIMNHLELKTSTRVSKVDVRREIRKWLMNPERIERDRILTEETSNEHK